MDFIIMIIELIEAHSYLDFEEVVVGSFIFISIVCLYISVYFADKWGWID